MATLNKIFLLSLLILMGSPVWADENPVQAVFTSVKGKVTVKLKKNHKSRPAKTDLTVVEGDRIIANQDSSATLRLFDGSSLDISPKTEFVLSKLQKPAEGEKTIKFKLIIGQLLAAVEKLTSSKSSFEIEAGGVVCGVRGTKFKMNCDGKPKPEVQLQVFEGVVYTVDSHGNKYYFRPGPPIKFANSVISDEGKKRGSANPVSNENKNSGNAGEGSGTTGLNDLTNNLGNISHNNTTKILGSTQSNVITIKPVVGN